MKEAEYSKLKTISKLLEDKEIQTIVEDILAGYELTNDAGIVFTSSDKEDIVSLSDGEGRLIFKKNSNSGLQIQIIESGPIVNEVNYEIRPNGIIITKVTKIYGYSRVSKDKKHITDLLSESYTLTSETIKNNYSEIITDEKYNLALLQEKIDINNLKDLADLVTNFETHIRTYQIVKGKLIGPPYSSVTILNGEDISHIYDAVDGPDALSKIYDLYNGIINSRNKYDMFNVNFGILRSEAFHLKAVKGIVAAEDNLVSNTITLSDYYRQYQNILKSMSPSGEVSFESRESMLESIRIRKCHKDDIEDTINLEKLLSKPINKILKKILNRTKSK